MSHKTEEGGGFVTTETGVAAGGPPLSFRHGFHLGTQEVQNMTEEQIKTLLNTVTTVSRTKKYAPPKSTTGILTSSAKRPPTSKKDLKAKARISMTVTPKLPEANRSRSVSVDSVRLGSTEDVVVKKTRPFSVDGQVGELGYHDSSADMDLYSDAELQHKNKIASDEDVSKCAGVDSSKDFQSFVVEDSENQHSDKLMCLAERMIAFSGIFPCKTIFSYNDASGQILIAAERRSSERSQSTTSLVESLRNQSSRILQTGTLPECSHCSRANVNSLQSYGYETHSQLWSHAQNSSYFGQHIFRSSPQDLKRQPSKKGQLRDSLAFDYGSTHDAFEMVNHTPNEEQLDLQTSELLEVYDEELPTFLWPYANEISDLKKAEAIERVLLEFSSDF